MLGDLGDGGWGELQIGPDKADTLDQLNLYRNI